MKTFKIISNYNSKMGKVTIVELNRKYRNYKRLAIVTTENMFGGSTLYCAAERNKPVYPGFKQFQTELDIITAMKEIKYEPERVLPDDLKDKAHEIMDELAHDLGGALHVLPLPIIMSHLTKKIKAHMDTESADYVNLQSDFDSAYDHLSLHQKYVNYNSEFYKYARAYFLGRYTSKSARQGDNKGGSNE